MAGGAEVDDLDLEVPGSGRDAVRGAHHAVALGAGGGEAVSQEQDPLGLEDAGEEHGLPRRALLGTGGARPGLSGGGPLLRRRLLILALAGGGPGPDAVFVPLRRLGLGFLLGCRRRRLAAGSPAVVITVDRGFETQRGMGNVETELLEGVGG